MILLYKDTNNRIGNTKYKFEISSTDTCQQTVVVVNIFDINCPAIRSNIF